MMVGFHDLGGGCLGALEKMGGLIIWSLELCMG